MENFDENIDYSSENVAVNLEQIPIATVYRNKTVLKLEKILKKSEAKKILKIIKVFMFIEIKDYWYGELGSG